MTQIVPTNYRRVAFRDRNREALERATDAQEVTLVCLRCFRPSIRSQRCDDCRTARETANKMRKR
jgi:thymidine kinase